MTELSSQAQAVFWAFNRAASGKPDDWHYLPAIAAAIRAAGEQCTYVARTELNLIADELEAFAQQPPSILAFSISANYRKSE